MSEANPFQDPLRFERRAPACAIVIFGANGDLTKRKLMPALYRLAYESRIPPAFAVIGNSRTHLSDEQFRDKMHEALEQFLEDTPLENELWESFARGLYYVAGDVNDPGFYQRLSAKLVEIQQARQTG